MFGLSPLRAGDRMNLVAATVVDGEQMRLRLFAVTAPDPVLSHSHNYRHCVDGHPQVPVDFPRTIAVLPLARSFDVLGHSTREPRRSASTTRPCWIRHTRGSCARLISRRSAWFSTDQCAACIGYRAIKSRPGPRGSGIRAYLDEIALHELSLTPFPANTFATVTAGKELDDPFARCRLRAPIRPREGLSAT
jgi:hypothetical protein